LDAIRVDVEEGTYDGAVVIVAREGEVALREAIGFANRDTSRAMGEDDVFCLFSISKALTATTLLQRVERGEIRLNTPVAEILPEFGRSGKQRVTIAQLLTPPTRVGCRAPSPPSRQKSKAIWKRSSRLVVTCHWRGCPVRP
jgi:CubicO group peptidase (beta-lactamase class C family)